MHVQVRLYCFFYKKRAKCNPMQNVNPVKKCTDYILLTGLVVANPSYGWENAEW